MKVVIGEDGLDPAVQAYLDGLSRSELHELVLTLAECSETVRRTLEAVAELAGVSVEPIDGLLVDFCRDRGISVVVKGVRFGSDFDYELQMSQLNRMLSGLETVLLPAGHEYGTVSSSMLREVAANHGDIGPFVTPAVDAAVRARIGY